MVLGVRAGSRYVCDRGGTGPVACPPPLPVREAWSVREALVGTLHHAMCRHPLRQKGESSVPCPDIGPASVGSRS